MKKIIVSLLLLLPLGLIAQEMKIAYVNTAEVFNMMPEVEEYQKALEKLKSDYENTMSELREEHDRKYADLVAKNDSLSENIRMLKIQDIEGLRERMEKFTETAQESMDKAQRDMLPPIQDKIMKAIQTVGEENGYSCILDPQIIMYKGSLIDATDKVKAKLGLK